MRALRDTLRVLRRRLAALEQAGPGEAGGLFGLGLPAVDAWLGGGLARSGLHEIFAGQVTDAGAAAGFVVGLLRRALPGGRSVVWIRQGFAEAEAGALHAPGLAEFGFDPGALILVQARDAGGVLRAGAEAVRCAALGAVVIEPWGSPKALDFTVTRRLALAVARSGVTTFLLRVAAEARPSAALTRWRVAAAASQPLAANAPGHPAFDIALLRHRAGIAGRSWRVEWDRDQGLFREAAPLPGAVVPLPAVRPAVAGIRDLARTA